MRIGRSKAPWLAVGVVLLGSGLAWAGTTGWLRAPDTLNPCAAKTLNPCAAKTLNPCAAKTLNPCAAKTLNPCAAKTLNPCAAKTLNPCQARTLNPCEAKALGQRSVKGNPCGQATAANPCGGNPCNPCGGGGGVDASRFVQPAGTKLLSGGRDLVAEGEKLWNDRFLGNSGLACSTCHLQNYGQMQPTFAQPYPHRVAMPHQQAGVDQVNAAEMVQFCMIVPMMSEPLEWNGRQLAALTAYVESIQEGYKPISGGPVNPCNPCNPCGR